MASVMNAFDLLQGGAAEQSLQSSKKKKKRGSQQKTAGDDAVSAQTAQAPTAATSSARGSAPKVFSVGEASAMLVQRAREASRGAANSAHCALWSDWIQQAISRASGAPRYKDEDGNPVDFTPVLLQSGALEVSVESAFSTGITPEHQERLMHLLYTFFPRLDRGGAEDLAASLVRLSGLVQAESLDVKSVSQRAVRGVLASLAALSSDATASAAEQAANNDAKINLLRHNVDKEASALQKLVANARSAVSKEHVDTADKIFRLTGQQFDLLVAEAHAVSAPAPEALAAASALHELRTAVTAKLKAGTPADNKGKGGKGGDAAASKAAAQANLRKEEALLASQVDAVASQIRTLEAQLRSLRVQQQDLVDKRAALQQRLNTTGGAAAGNKGGSAGPTAAQLQQELEAIDQLSSVFTAAAGGVVGGSDAMEAGEVAAVGSQLVTAARHFLEYARMSLADVPGRISFCKERQAQAEKLQRYGAKDNQKIKDDADRLMNETVRTTEDLLQRSVVVVSQLSTRAEALLRSARPSDPTIAEGMRAVDALLADIRANYDTVQALLRPPAPPPMAASQPVHTAPVAPPPLAGAPRPTSAAPAPVVQAVASAPPAPVAAPTPAPAAPSLPKSSFDLAGEFLANAKLLGVAAARPESPAGARKVAPAVRAPVAPPVDRAPPRQWGKPASAPSADASPSIDEASGLPTPAEAFKANAPLPGAGDHEAKGQKKPARLPKA